MPIRLGRRPDHSFENPLGLLSDCHRRIEQFLEVLIIVAERSAGAPLTAGQREALEGALRYFRVAAPKHTRDEEVSLFPLLRQLDQPAVREAMGKLAELEADHDAADQAHARVDAIGSQWLREGTLPTELVSELSSLLCDLRALYRRHIVVEDRELFPLAGRVLEPAQLASVGREMAQRRGIRTDGR
jgi:hemerythrin-like domain-containing protein